MYILLYCQTTGCPTAFDCPSAAGRGRYSSLSVRSIFKSLADLEGENLRGKTSGWISSLFLWEPQKSPLWRPPCCSNGSDYVWLIPNIETSVFHFLSQATVELLIAGKLSSSPNEVHDYIPQGPWHLPRSSQLTFSPYGKSLKRFTLKSFYATGAIT